MFDIGWSEMAVIALIALVVIGPKELPKAMRTAAKWARKARSLAREFQSGVDDMIREADLEDTRKALDVTRSFDIAKAVEDTVDPTGSIRDEAGDLESTARETVSAQTEPAQTEPAQTEPGGAASAETESAQIESAQMESVGAVPAEDSSDAVDRMDAGAAEDAAADKAGEDKAGADEAGADKAGTDEAGTDETGTDETGGATVIEHPLNIAPPHSLTPPPAEGEATAEASAPPSGDDGSQTRAKGP